MKYRRLNITLPDEVVKKLAKVPNKSAFIADAIVWRLARRTEEADRAARLAAYKWIAAHPEYEKDARPDW